MNTKEEKWKENMIRGRKGGVDEGSKEEKMEKRKIN